MLSPALELVRLTIPRRVYTRAEYRRRKNLADAPDRLP